MNGIKTLMTACCLWATAALADPPPNYSFVSFDRYVRGVPR